MHVFPKLKILTNYCCCYYIYYYDEKAKEEEEEKDFFFFLLLLLWCVLLMMMGIHYYCRTQSPMLGTAWNGAHSFLERTIGVRK